jgi:hypothetical protein
VNVPATTTLDEVKISRLAMRHIQRYKEKKVWDITISAYLLSVVPFLH